MMLVETQSSLTLSKGGDTESLNLPSTWNLQRWFGVYLFSENQSSGGFGVLTPNFEGHSLIHEKLINMDIDLDSYKT